MTVDRFCVVKGHRETGLRGHGASAARDHRGAVSVPRRLSLAAGFVRRHEVHLRAHWRTGQPSCRSKRRDATPVRFLDGVDNSSPTGHTGSSGARRPSWPWPLTDDVLAASCYSTAGGYQSNQPSGAQNFTISVTLHLVKHFTVFAKAPIFPLMRLLTIGLSFVLATPRYSRSAKWQGWRDEAAQIAHPPKERGEFSGMVLNGAKSWVEFAD